MGKTPLIDPFNHESRREKKLRAKHSARDLASQQTLSSLVNGTYQPPRMANHSRLRSSTSSRTSKDIGNSYQQEYHYVPDPDNHFEAESQSHIPHESHNRSVAGNSCPVLLGIDPMGRPFVHPKSAIV
ncbi:hypothetical protein Pst134EB_018768 [Puccinia striiformis f. sp. tritici]|nr:hypothetical protein Pst134EB_018768 [Puccinia striiformis f. sp. tritici]